MPRTISRKSMRKDINLEYWCSGCQENLSLPPVKIPVKVEESDLGKPFINVVYHFFCYQCAWAMFHRFLGYFRRKKHSLILYREDT